MTSAPRRRFSLEFKRAETLLFVSHSAASCAGDAQAGALSRSRPADYGWEAGEVVAAYEDRARKLILISEMKCGYRAA
jgi:hypothetical protein